MILTHDWSFLVGMKAIDEKNFDYNKMAFKSVSIGDYSLLEQVLLYYRGRRLGNIVLLEPGLL